MSSSLDFASLINEAQQRPSRLFHLRTRRRQPFDHRGLWRRHRFFDQHCIAVARECCSWGDDHSELFLISTPSRSYGYLLRGPGLSSPQRAVKTSADNRCKLGPASIAPSSDGVFPCGQRAFINLRSSTRRRRDLHRSEPAAPARNSASRDLADQANFCLD